MEVLNQLEEELVGADVREAVEGNEEDIPIIDVPPAEQESMVDHEVGLGEEEEVPEQHHQKVVSFSFFF